MKMFAPINTSPCADRIVPDIFVWENMLNVTKIDKIRILISIFFSIKTCPPQIKFQITTLHSPRITGNARRTTKPHHSLATPYSLRRDSVIWRVEETKLKELQIFIFDDLNILFNDKFRYPGNEYDVIWIWIISVNGINPVIFFVITIHSTL